jgi:diadenosine tetraphosphatase ApaH/serine/threonine PP2A family protein phosphatase
VVRLDYQPSPIEAPGPGWSKICYAPPAGRKAVFVGDLVDRGPRIVDSLSLVRNMVAAGSAICVPGNHDIKLLRKLRGKNVQITHGLAESLAEVEAIPDEERESFCKELVGFIDGLVSHYVLDKVVVAHAGIKESMQGRGSGKVREFALYGETTGETDEFGLPVRHNWAAEYRGDTIVVYGHTPVPQPDWLNKTINIDTGCVFGGALTALRYPEQEFVSVKAKQTYCEPAKPFLEDEQKSPALSTQQGHDDLLDLADVTGKRIVSTRLTEKGGEGMVVKPLDFIARGKKGLLQPAVKCRGREYLRIIYSPDYTSEANLTRLRNRGLGAKRSLALREFALGIEALERFVRREPLRRVHECVFGVLAMESEPVDPRL